MSKVKLMEKEIRKMGVGMELVRLDVVEEDELMAYSIPKGPNFFGSESRSLGKSWKVAIFIE